MYKIPNLNHRISKEESILIAQAFLDSQIVAKLIIKKLQKGSEIERYSILWSLRNLPLKDQNTISNFPILILETIHCFPKNNSIKRSGLAILQDINIPAEIMGELYTTCFNFLTNSSEAIVTKVFSMSICFRIAKIYPELLNELRLIIEENLVLFGRTSPGIFSRGNKILTQISLFS